MKKFATKGDMVNYIADAYNIDVYNDVKDPVEVVKKVMNIEGFFEQVLEYSIDMTVLDSKVIEKAKKYIEEYNEHSRYGRGLYIFGELGVGKTTLAGIIAHEIFKKKAFNENALLKVKFITVNDFIQTCRDKMKNLEDRKAYNKLLNADLVVLDNIGNEYMWKSEESGNFVGCILDEFMKQRYGNNKPTILTSNVKPENLGVKYGEVVQDLINASCLGINIDTYSVRKLSSIMEML